MRRQLLGSLVVCLVAASVCRADDWTMHLTCDNQFDLYFGTPGATTSFEGGGTSWSTTYTFSATGRAPSDYIYVATASDQTQAQGFIGDFTNTTAARTSFTGDAVWQVFNAGAYLSQMGLGSGPWPASLQPTRAQVDTAIAYANANNRWVAPTSGGQNGVGPWGLRPNIDANARWIWYNANGSPDPTQGSFNHDEFLVFRLAGIVPAPGALAPLALALLGASRRRR